MTGIINVISLLQEILHEDELIAQQAQPLPAAKTRKRKRTVKPKASKEAKQED